MKYFAKVNILQPAYLKRFSCIGANCEDNCCHGRIAVDQETFRAFKMLPDSDIRRDFFAASALNKDGNAHQYASLQSPDAGNCPMLTEKGLCRIHAGLGEEYLSCACYTVPKRVNRIGADFEISLRLFCPEACRVALLENGVMEFDSFEDDLGAKLHIMTDMPVEKAEEIQPAWFGIRSAFIDILQDRRFGVGHRLVLAGLAAERLEAMNRDGASAADVTAFLEGITREYATDASAAELLALRCGDEALFARLLSQACIIAASHRLNSEAYISLVMKAWAYYGADHGAPPEEMAVRWRQAAAKFDAYFGSKEYILENWLINLVFSRCFPLRNQKSILAEYTRFVLYYFMLKVLLTGCAGAGEPLDDALLVKFLHLFSMLVENEHSFEEAIDEFIRANALADMRAIIGLALTPA
jgi:lysine-N-methylase